MSAARPEAAKKRHVYVIGGGDGPLKIGVSRNLVSRVISLRGPARRALTVMASVPRPDDAYAVERVAHKLLAEKRSHGEWFNVSLEEAMAAVAQAIEDVESGRIEKFTRKQLDLPNEMWDEISTYRYVNRIPSEAEAVRRLLRAGLDAKAERPLKNAKS